MFRTGTCTVAATPLLAGAFFFGIPTVSAHAAGPTLTFATALRTNVSANPLGVQVADFNGDGNLDAAFASASANTVVVMIGDGNGGFGAPSSYVVGDIYSDVAEHNVLAVGDYDGDGDTDIVTTSYAAKTLSFLLNDGTGQFAPASSQTIPGIAGGGSYSITSADINNDGRSEVVVCKYFQTGLTVIARDNSGNLTVLTENSGLGYTYSATPADLTGDGVDDVLGGARNGARTFSNVASGTFGQVNTYPSSLGTVYGVAAGDLNGDGNDDAVITEGSTVASALGTGTGALDAWSTATTSGHSVSVSLSDLNGDGFLDAAVGNKDPYSNTVSANLGNGDGTFETDTSFVVGASSNATPSSVATGDMNNDGRPDIVATNFVSGELAVLLNTTTFAAPTVASVAPSSGPTTGGTAVTITGTNLGSAYSVKFGTVAATSFTVNSPTSITATAPAAAAAGASTITIKAGGGTTTGAFTYTGGKQKQTAGACADFPTSLPAAGTKKLISKSCRTNAGQKITATAAARFANRGDIRTYKIYKKRGATYVRTYGYPINLRLTYKAPATSTYSAYKATSNTYKL